jgi:hypothetical protein
LKKISNNREHIELRGEVRAADLDARQFSLRLDDGTKIVAEFTTEQEQTITKALSEHAKRRVRLKGSAEVTREGKVKRIACVESLAIEPAEVVQPVSDGKPLWQAIVELGESVPEEEWAKVPTDGARNLHHYLYGAPKVPEK